MLDSSMRRAKDRLGEPLRRDCRISRLTRFR